MLKLYKLMSYIKLFHTLSPQKFTSNIDAFYQIISIK